MFGSSIQQDQTDNQNKQRSELYVVKLVIAVKRCALQPLVVSLGWMISRYSAVSTQCSTASIDLGAA